MAGTMPSLPSRPSFAEQFLAVSSLAPGRYGFGGSPPRKPLLSIQVAANSQPLPAVAGAGLTRRGLPLRRDIRRRRFPRKPLADTGRNGLASYGVPNGLDLDEKLHTLRTRLVRPISTRVLTTEHALNVTGCRGLELSCEF